MKKVLVAVLAVGMFTAAADAALLGIRWQSTGEQTISLEPSDSAVIEVVLDLAAGQSVINFFGGNEPAPATQTGVITPIAGWMDASTGAALGHPAQQVSVGAPGGTPVLAGPGSFVIAEQTIHLDSGVLSDIVEVTWAHGTLGILDPTGAAYSYAPGFAGFPGYWGYGTYGSPGVTSPFGSDPRSPLLIHVVPEPASLALMGLGVFGLIRRRR